MHDTSPFPDTATSTVAPAAKTAARCCPHWSPGNKTCLLVTEGLFLPVEEHIIAYCGAKFYPACPHFQRLAAPKTDPHHADALAVNRRRSARIPQYHIFHFSEVSSNDHSPENRTEESWTIDLSQHGIRFVSYRLLEPETLIGFSLESRHNIPPTKGQGRVVWSEALENSQLFHTGITFA